MDKSEMLRLASQLEACVGRVPWFSARARAAQLCHAVSLLASNTPELSNDYACGVARMVRELAHKRR